MSLQLLPMTMLWLLMVNWGAMLTRIVRGMLLIILRILVLT